MAKRSAAALDPASAPPSSAAAAGGTRPGQQAGRPGSPGREPDSDELERAAELEAQIVAEERTATESMSRGRDPPPARGASPHRPRPVGSLTAVAEDEYRYVVRDLRRIAVVFAGIFGILLVSWLVIGVSGLVTL